MRKKQSPSSSLHYDWGIFHYSLWVTDLEWFFEGDVVILPTTCPQRNKAALLFF